MGKIAILGAGAIGQLLHHQLQHYMQAKPALTNNNNHLFLCTRQFERPSQLVIDTQPLDSRPLEPSKTYIDPVQWIDCDTQKTTTQQALGQVDLMIVTVKAYQVVSALTPLLGYLKTDCHVLLLHNGMGPHLAIAPLLNGRGLSLGTTSQAALKLKPFHIRQTGHGLTQIGHYAGEPLSRELTLILTSSIPNCQWVEDVMQALWQKLAINAAINPLTAVHQCKNGQLAQAKYQRQITNIVHELVAVATAEGISLDEVALLQRVFHVIELTQSNYSSMHQDVAHQRQTEIAAINGYVVARAKAHGIDAKYNLAMLNAVQSLSEPHLS